MEVIHLCIGLRQVSFGGGVKNENGVTWRVRHREGVVYGILVDT